MAEQDVLDKLNDVLDRVADNKEKLVEIEAKVIDIYKRAMSFVYTCTDCWGAGCSTCDNTGLLPRPS